MVITTDRTTGTEGTGETDRTDKWRGLAGQTDLTFKLDFPGNLCRAAFAILAMFRIAHMLTTNVQIKQGEFKLSDGYWHIHSALTARAPGLNSGLLFLLQNGKHWLVRRKKENSFNSGLLLPGDHSGLFPHSYMRQIPQDGENDQNVAFFLFFEALLWPNGLIFFNFSQLFWRDFVRYSLKILLFWS